MHRPSAALAGSLLLATVIASSTTPGAPAAPLAVPLVPAGAQSAPPPTPVPPYGSPSPYPSSLPTPRPSARPPRLGVPAAALVDLDDGDVLFQKGGRTRRPIASLTKIMTALLVVERARPGDVVTVSALAAAEERGATLQLEPGEELTVRDLLHALMLQSSNDAAVALGEHVGGSLDAFIRMMNARARALGLRDTRFFSPNGLDDRGYSTALDLARLTVKAMKEPMLARVVRTRFHRIPAPTGPARRLQNRNALLWLYPDAIGVKSGYTAAAGFCLVGAAERQGLRLAAVALGGQFEAFTDSAALLNYGFAAFERRYLALQGEWIGRLLIEGRAVIGASEGTVTARVPRGAEAVRRVVLDPGLSLPLAVGDRIGEMVVEVRGRRVGRVPLVAAQAVGRPPRPRPRLPLAQRVWEAASAFVAALARSALG